MKIVTLRSQREQQYEWLNIFIKSTKTSAAYTYIYIPSLELQLAMGVLKFQGQSTVLRNI